jgi:hypothetical protein
MKHLLLVLSLFVFTSSLWGATPGIYHVSLTEKGLVNSFLNRLATMDHHLVITDQPVEGAMRTMAIEIKDGESLYIVESPRPLPEGDYRVVGEMEGFYLVITPDHTIHPDPTRDPVDSYWEVLGQRSHYAPMRERLPIPSRGGFIDRPEISVAFLQQQLEALSGETPIRVNGATETIRERQSSEGRALARAYLKEQYEALGFEVREHPFSSFFNKGVNFIAEKRGGDPSRTLLVTSHYDSVNTPGADDNGSGTIGALAIAKAFADKKLRHTLRIVAFDQEETGLVGSKAYAKYLDEQGELDQVIGVLNMDIIGYDSDNDGAFHIMDCGENSSDELTTLYLQTIGRLKLDLTVKEYCTNRSDHASFWKYNIPAVILSENYFKGDPNNCIHNRCDRVDIINFDYMRDLLIGATATVGAILE